MQLIGYSLVDLSTSTPVLVARTIPPRIEYEKDGELILRVDGAKLGDDIEGLNAITYKIVERHFDDAVVPGVDEVRDGETISFDGVKVVVTPTFRPMTQEEIDARDASVAEQTRRQAFNDDAERQTLLDKAREATPQEIEGYIRNQINVDGVTDLASAKLCLKRIETALVRMTKLLVNTAV